jgi:hypothetical protein
MNTYATATRRPEDVVTEPLPAPVVEPRPEEFAFDSVLPLLPLGGGGGDPLPPLCRRRGVREGSRERCTSALGVGSGERRASGRLVAVRDVCPPLGPLSFPLARTVPRATRTTSPSSSRPGEGARITR